MNPYVAFLLYLLAILAFVGLTMEQAQAAVQNAIGGETVTTTVEGRERFAVNVRYMRDFRQDLPALRRVLDDTAFMMACAATCAPAWQDAEMAHTSPL